MFFRYLKMCFYFGNRKTKRLCDLGSDPCSGLQVTVESGCEECADSKHEATRGQRSAGSCLFTVGSCFFFFCGGKQCRVKGHSSWCQLSWHTTPSLIFSEVSGDELQSLHRLKTLQIYSSSAALSLKPLWRQLREDKLHSSDSEKALVWIHQRMQKNLTSVSYCRGHWSGSKNSEGLTSPSRCSWGSDELLGGSGSQ